MDKVQSSSYVSATDNANYLLDRYEITSKNLVSIRNYGKLITDGLDQYVTHFYTWMEKQPEFSQFFSNHALLKKVQGHQVDYWQDFFKAKVDNDYLERRRLIGETHARIGLSIDSYLTATLEENNIQALLLMM